MMFPASLKSSPKPKKLIKIAILDTGYTKKRVSKLKLCDSGSKDFTNSYLEDTVGHGTHISNIIADRTQNVNYCAIIIKWYDRNLSSEELIQNTLDAFKYVDTLDGISIVNYSAGGKSSSVEERDAILALTLKGIKVFVAAGNEGNDLDKDCNFFPACYNIDNMVVVGNKNKDGTRYHNSNYGKKVTKWEVGVDVLANAGIYGNIPLSGTSQATALETAKYLNQLEKENK